MEVTALVFTQLMFLTDQVTAGVQSKQHDFRIVTDRSQYFEYESVSFRCEGLDGSSQLRGVGNNKGFIQRCDLLTLSCTIEVAYQTDSGQYWCESTRGRSNSVNITVTAGSVILEAPALPATAGENVTLRCRSKTPTTQAAVFYRDGVTAESSSAEEMILYSVSTSDEGVYRCSISDAGTSPGSRLLVTDPPSDGSDSPDVLVLSHAAVIACKGVLLLLLLGFSHFRKHGDGDV